VHGKEQSYTVKKVLESYSIYALETMALATMALATMALATMKALNDYTKRMPL